MFHGYVGSWYLTASAISEALSDAADTPGIKKVIISIHSGGGEVFEGWAIYNAIRNFKALEVTTRVDGIAASMASVVMMAPSVVEISRNAMVMVHKPSSYSWGNADDLRKAVEMLDKVEGVMVKEYVRRTNLKAEEVTQMLAKETWLTPEEALEKGFVTAIVDGDAVEDDVEAMAALGLSGLAASFMNAAARQMATAKPKAINKQDLYMEKVKQALGLPASATEAEVLAAVNDQKATTQTVLAEADKRKAADIKAAIDQAILEGRCTEAQRASLEKIGNTDFQILKDTLAMRPSMVALQQSIKGAAGAGADDRSKWPLVKWLEADPEGLKAQEDAQPGFIEALKERLG